ncbi:MAG: hypothetical protein AB8H86_33490 [Polyangiales bacterium]
MADDEETTKPRKEKVLHTRVPAVLEQELKALAQNLRVPVSNVVRTILEDAVKTVDVIGRRAESELRDVAKLLGPKQPYARGAVVAASTEGPPLAAVVGYQAIRLARDESCTLCGGELPRGSEAHLGIRDDGGARVLLGPECLPFRAREENQ